MENLRDNRRSGQVLRGLIIVVIGAVFLLQNIGLDIPYWVLSWHTLLLVLGIFIGARRNFTGIGWLIMVLIGFYYTLEAITALHFELSKYGLGAGLVILGTYIIIKPRSRFKDRFNVRYKHKFSRTDAFNATDEFKKSAVNNQDIIDVVAVFGGSHQTVYSKNFKGGDITAIFGGADINLVQADFEETAVIDVSAIFGGVKLVVPQNWAIKSNVTAAFGSVEDKRVHTVPADGLNKTLVLQGVAFFGGIEIKSY